MKFCNKTLKLTQALYLLSFDFGLFTSSEGIQTFVVWANIRTRNGEYPDGSITRLYVYVEELQYILAFHLTKTSHKSHGDSIIGNATVLISSYFAAKKGRHQAPHCGIFVRIIPRADLFYIVNTVAAGNLPRCYQICPWPELRWGMSSSNTKYHQPRTIPSKQKAWWGAIIVSQRCFNVMITYMISDIFAECLQLLT